MYFNNPFEKYLEDSYEEQKELLVEKASEVKEKLPEPVKKEIEDLSCRPCNHPKPPHPKPYNPQLYYTTDISNGYVQNIQGRYFAGTGDEQPFGMGRSAFFILINPHNSNINAFINKIFHSNLSHSPMQVSSYFIPSLCDSFLNYDSLAKVQIADTDNRNSIQMLLGNSVEIPRQISKLSSIVVPGFETFTDNVAGSVLLRPGDIYITRIDSVCEKEAGTCQDSFAWWEDPIRVCD